MDKAALEQLRAGIIQYAVVMGARETRPLGLLATQALQARQVTQGALARLLQG